MKSLKQNYNEPDCYWSKNADNIDKCQHDFSKTAYFTAKVDLRLFEQSIKAESSVKIIPPSQLPDRVNGDIQFFSKNSRSRLIRLFSTISLSAYRKLIYITLSFHEDYPSDNIQLKKFLDNYLKRIKRGFTNIAYIWRFEYQKRGAPHFHFIFLIPNNSTEVSLGKFIKSCRNHFIDIKGCTCVHCCKYGFDFDELETSSKVFSYISKYCAKIDEQNNANYSGRRWGYSRNIIRSEVNIVTLRGYQFQYFKQLLFNHYQAESGKAEYINTNIKTLYSWFLLCPFDTASRIIKQVLSTNLEKVFNELQTNKVFYEDYLLDVDNCIIGLHLDSSDGLWNSSKNYFNGISDKNILA